MGNCKGCQKYAVVRFTMNAPQRIMHINLPLEYAQMICNDPATSGDGWFYGFRKQTKFDVDTYNSQEPE